MAKTESTACDVDRGTQDGIDRHKAAGELLCRDCRQASKAAAQEASRKQMSAAPADVEQFRSRAYRLMETYDLGLCALAREMGIHYQTLQTLLKGDSTPRKTSLTRASECLDRMEHEHASATPEALRAGERAAKVREEHNRRAYEKWRQRREARMRVRGEPAPELISS
ncbi:hypothetical protein AVL63_04535 [Nesterenkonia jeotgali]|uniref:Uncharacterized protein n=1 Tax=Nesterenkonia jeotgali TaxID=317018 RepID=A0A0W8ICW1_9MICC|nr:hypothetical protein AVL63_04535 [Nesterenkonia jeotgali]